MKRVIRLITKIIFVIAIIVLGTYNNEVQAKNSTQYCGQYATWSIDKRNSSELKLIIAGSGDMYDYSKEQTKPWQKTNTYTDIYGNTISGTITSIEIGENITSIGDYAFHDMHNIETVTFTGKSIKTIGKSAFENCTELHTVNFTSTLETIEESAFKNTALRIAEFRRNLKSIGNSAFADVPNLTQIAFETDTNSSITIGIQAFRGAGITEITLPAAVKEVGAHAFANCINLSSVTIRNNTKLESIPLGMFDNCYLRRVTLPEGIKNISGSAFNGSTDLELIVPSSVISIGYQAFAHVKHVSFLNSKLMSHPNYPFGARQEHRLTDRTDYTKPKCQDNTKVLACSVPNCSYTEMSTIKATETCSAGTYIYEDSNNIKNGYRYKKCTKCQQKMTATEQYYVNYIYSEGISGVESGYFNKNIPLVHSFAVQTGYKYVGCDGDIKVTAPSNLTYVLSNKALTIKVLAEPEIYKVTLDKSTGIQSVTGAGNYAYGTEYTIQAVVKPGYTFDAWVGENVTYSSKTLKLKMEASDVNLKALAKPNKDTKYMVKYYVMNADGTFSNIPTYTKQLLGTTDTLVEVQYILFTASELTEAGLMDKIKGTRCKINNTDVLAGNIHGDGSLVIDVFYYIKEIEKDNIKYRLDVSSDNKALEAIVVGTTKSKEDTILNIPDTVYFGDEAINIVKIEDEIFKDYTNLKEVYLGKNIKSIGKNAFKGCTKLEKVVTSNKSIAIDSTSFSGCSNIKSSGIDGLVNNNNKNDKNNKNDNKNNNKESNSKLSVGKTFTVNSMKYKITKLASNNNEVTLIGTSKNKSDKTFTKLNIGKTVKYNGNTFKITSVGKKAFKGYTNIKTITVGKNITKIEAQAFYGCKKVKTIIIKSNKLTTVNKKAITNINKKTIIKVPSSKVKAYKRLFKSSTGYKKTMKIKK